MNTSCLNIPAFDGFPYIVTQFLTSYRHIILLPKDMELATKLDVSVRQATVNKLLTGLVLSHDAAVYIWPNGSQSFSHDIPTGAYIVSGKLRPAARFSLTEELLKRQLRLNQFERQYSIDGALFGDLAKGGYTASLDEWRRLHGTWANGVPRGLFQCDACSGWRGVCLDPNPVYFGKITRATRVGDFQEFGIVDCDPDLLRFGRVVTVRCRCENDNFCASCARPLYDWKLNTNHYSPSDGRVIHVPAFSALGHRCFNRTETATNPRK